MAGVLKFRTKKKALHHLALPGESGWDLWSFSSPAVGKLEKNLPVAEISTLPAETRVALPVRESLNAPIWLQTDETALFGQMIPVQLEKRGLIKNPDEPPHYFYHLIAQKEGRSLVFVLLINPELAPAYCLDLTGDYDFSARCRALPMDGYTFWKEEGSLVMALTREGKVSYLQAFPAAELSAGIFRDLLCLHARLTWEGVTASSSIQLFLQGNFTSEETSSCQEILGTTPSRVEAHLPLFLETAIHLTPAPVTAARVERVKKARWLQIWNQVGIVYLLIILAVLLQYGWLFYQTSRLKAYIQSQSAIVDRLNNISDRWRALQPALDPHYYPMETLLAAVKNLPPEARLTLFEHSPNSALIKGETSDAANAFQFLNSMRQDSDLKKWTWNMPQPELLQNSHAQFQLEGTHGSTPSK